MIVSPNVAASWYHVFPRGERRVGPRCGSRWTTVLTVLLEAGLSQTWSNTIVVNANERYDPTRPTAVGAAVSFHRRAIRDLNSTSTMVVESSGSNRLWPVKPSAAMPTVA